MAGHDRPRVRRVRNTDTNFGGNNMTDREWREYCRGIRLFRDAGITTPFHEAMNEQGKETAALAIESALRERELAE